MRRAVAAVQTEAAEAAVNVSMHVCTVVQSEFNMELPDFEELVFGIEPPLV